MTSFKRARTNVLFALLFCYLFYYCARQNFGFAIIGIRSSLGLSVTDTGIISAIMLFSYGLGQIVNGYLGDHYSPRLFVTLGGILSVFFNFTASFAIGFWTLAIPCFFIGYTQALGFAPGSKLITNWWEKAERGKVFGFYLCASAISSIIVYALSILTLSYFTWPWVFRLPPLFLLVSSIIFYLLVRDRPEGLGLSPSINFYKDNLTYTPQKYRKLFKHFKFQMAAITMGFLSIARYTLIIWLPLIYFDQTHEKNAWLTIFLPLGMAVGTLTSGIISDRYFASDKIKPIVLFMILASLTLITLYFTPLNYTYFAMFLLTLSGFFVYGPQSSLFAMCPELLGTELTSAGVGLMNAYGYAFSGASEVFIGWLIQYTGRPNICFLIVAISCIATIIFMLLMTSMESGLMPTNDNTEKV